MHPALARDATRFELRNALWMNAAHAVLYTFFALVLAFVLVLLVPRRLWLLVYVLPLLPASLWGAWNRWRRTFDRSVQLVIDETGVLATRSRFGQIRWSDITDAQCRYWKSGGCLVLTFKDAQPWIRHAGWLARTIFSYRSCKPFSAWFSLTDMSFDRAPLHRFVNSKTSSPASRVR